MTRQQERHVCPECGEKAAKKYGKQNGVQKYYCYRCKKYVLDKIPHYSKKSKKFLSMLINFLNMENDNNINIIEAINNIDKNFVDSSNVSFVKEKVYKDSQINCSNPRLLISLERNKIIMHFFDKHYLNKTNHCEYLIVHDINNCVKNQDAE